MDVDVEIHLIFRDGSLFVEKLVCNLLLPVEISIKKPHHRNQKDSQGNGFGTFSRSLASTKNTPASVMQ